MTTNKVEKKKKSPKNSKKSNGFEFRVKDIKGLQKGGIYWVTATKENIQEKQLKQVVEILKKTVPDCQWVASTTDLKLLGDVKGIEGVVVSKRRMEKMMKRVKTLEDENLSMSEAMKMQNEQFKTLLIEVYEMKERMSKIEGGKDGVRK